MSVLVGLVLSDLFSAIHACMVLWPLAELAVAATAPGAGVVVTILFMRDWREAVLVVSEEAPAS